MGSRLLEGGVVLALLLSAGLIGLLLAAPLLPRPAAIPPVPATTPRPTVSAAPEQAIPPLGLYLLRQTLFGPCLAVELVPQSYPLVEGVAGTARVMHWERGMTGCDARSGEVGTVEAAVTAVPDDDAPDAPPIGYAMRFRLPIEDGMEIDAELMLLSRQSTPNVLQALDTSSGGAGLVLDRVEAVDPPLNPLPSGS